MGRVGVLQQILERSAFWKSAQRLSRAFAFWKSLNVISTNYYTRSIWIRRASFSIEFFECFHAYFSIEFFEFFRTFFCISHVSSELLFLNRCQPGQRKSVLRRLQQAC